MAEHADKKIIIEDGVQEIVKEDEQDLSEEPESLVFPFARVKKLILMATNDGLRSDSVKLISKATELFLQDFIQKAHTFTKAKSKKTIMLNDIIQAVYTYENLEFIKDSGILNVEKSSQETPNSQKTPKNSQAALPVENLEEPLINN